MATLVALCALALPLTGGCLRSPWTPPQGGLTEWEVLDQDRPANQPWSPNFPAEPFGSRSATWVSLREVAYTSASGVSILNTESGTFKRFEDQAYLLSANQEGVLAAATSRGLVILRQDGTSLVGPTYEDLGRIVGLEPETADPAGHIPVMDGLAWSPTGHKLAVLVQARSTVSLVDARSVVAVLDAANPSSFRVYFERDGLAGRVRLVAWLDEDTLLVFHNDYLEPEDDRAWATLPDPIIPPPTATMEAVDLRQRRGAGKVLLVVPWHSRVSVAETSAAGLVLGVFQSPAGPNVTPAGGSFLTLPSGEALEAIPELVRPLTAPDAQGGYLALRNGNELVAIRRGRVFLAGRVNASLLRMPLAGHWTLGLCPNPDGTRVAEIGQERVRVFTCGW